MRSLEDSVRVILDERPALLINAGGAERLNVGIVEPEITGAGVTSSTDGPKYKVLAYIAAGPRKTFFLNRGEASPYATYTLGEENLLPAISPVAQPIR